MRCDYPTPPSPIVDNDLLPKAVGEALCYYPRGEIGGSPSGKQPLILLHGVARVAHTFDHLAPHFSKNYHVIAVDMRGHGDSAWDPQGAYLVEDYVKDIEVLVERLQLCNIVLWGNSTGGRVAQVSPDGTRTWSRR